MIAPKPQDNGIAGGKRREMDSTLSDLAALATALARDAAEQARAERAQAFQRALEQVGEALL